MAVRSAHTCSPTPSLQRSRDVWRVDLRVVQRDGTGHLAQSTLQAESDGQDAFPDGQEINSALQFVIEHMCIIEVEGVELGAGMWGRVETSGKKGPSAGFAAADRTKPRLHILCVRPLFVRHR